MKPIVDETYTVEYAHRELTRAFGSYRLAEVLLEINQACRRWAAGQLATAMPNLQQVEPGNPLFYWIAGETARHAIWRCPRPASDSPILLPHRSTFKGWASLEPILQRAVDAQLKVPIVSNEKWVETLHSQSLHSAMGRIWLPQYILGRNSPHRVGQALMMYRDGPDRRRRRDLEFPIDKFRAALKRALGGVALEPFLFALLHAFTQACSERPELSNATLAPVFDRSYDGVVFSEQAGLLTPAYGALFRAMSATPSEMLNWSSRQLGGRGQTVDDARAPFDAPNPLLRFPLVQCFPDRNDCCLAPVPHLILEWLYEPLVDILVGPGGFDAFAAAALFEEYVGLLADRCSPHGPGWLHESELQADLGEGQKVVDWARPLGDYVVLVDAKRCYIEPAARYRWLADDWRTAKKSWTKGVRQACEFWSAVKSDRVGALSGSGPKRPVAVIVTQGDAAFHASRDDWRSEIDAGLADVPIKIPWVVMSLDQYETVMTAWRKNDVDWLPALLLRAATDRSAASFREIKMEDDGPLWETHTRFLHEQISRVDPDLAQQLLDEIERRGAND